MALGVKLDPLGRWLLGSSRSTRRTRRRVCVSEKHLPGLCHRKGRGPLHAGRPCIGRSLRAGADRGADFLGAPRDPGEPARTADHPGFPESHASNSRAQGCREATLAPNRPARADAELEGQAHLRGRWATGGCSVRGPIRSSSPRRVIVRPWRQLGVPTLRTRSWPPRKKGRRDRFPKV